MVDTCLIEFFRPGGDRGTAILIALFLLIQRQKMNFCKQKFNCKATRYVQCKIQTYYLNKIFNTLYYLTVWFNSYCMIRSLWKRDDQWLVLEHFKVNLFICLHLEMISSPVPSREEDVPLFSLISPSDIDRSSVCKLCKEELFEAVFICFSIALSFQMYLESYVVFCLFRFLNVAV